MAPGLPPARDRNLKDANAHDTGRQRDMIPSRPWCHATFLEPLTEPSQLTKARIITSSILSILAAQAAGWMSYCLIIAIDHREQAEKMIIDADWNGIGNGVLWVGIDYLSLSSVGVIATGGLLPAILVCSKRKVARLALPFWRCLLLALCIQLPFAMVGLELFLLSFSVSALTQAAILYVALGKQALGWVNYRRILHRNRIQSV